MAVARRMGLTWDDVDEIMARAVAPVRGAQAPWGMRAEADRAGKEPLPEAARVRDGGDGPGREACALSALRQDEGVAEDSHFSALPEAVRASVEVAAMDMWRPYMDAAARWLWNAAGCFIGVYEAKHLGDAVKRFTAV